MSKYLISVLDIRGHTYMFLTIFDNTVVESDNKVDNYKRQAAVEVCVYKLQLNVVEIL